MLQATCQRIGAKLVRMLPVFHREGWAHDPTYSHYKRAKPTQTDPEDDKNADPSLPVGSTSKTFKNGWKLLEAYRQWLEMGTVILVISTLEAQNET